MSRLPSENLPHNWLKPPAGTASSGDKICSRCGVKRSTSGDTACDGADRDITIETVHEYDPLP